MEKTDIDNRFTFHPPPDQATVDAYETLRGKAKELAHLINDMVPEGREKSTAITKLEEASMWANAGIARQPGKASL